MRIYCVSVGLIKKPRPVLDILDTEIREGKTEYQWQHHFITASSSANALIVVKEFFCGECGAQFKVHDCGSA